MEKFAVDLEKVLDEFEYNEEREENVSTSSIKNSPLPQLNLGPLRQIPPVRPPAASYRRPSFEPINLADADFAASPKSSNPGFNHSLSGTQNENDGTYNFLSSKSQVNNKNYVQPDDIVSSLNNEVNINKQILTNSEESSMSNIWQRVNTCLSGDEKPDLLENNSKNVGVETNDLEIQNQLPDVTTSIRTSSYSMNNNEVDNLSNSLDLISSASGSLLKEHDEENYSKIKSDSQISLDCGEMEKDLSLHCTSFREISLLDYNDSPHSLNDTNIPISCIINNTSQENSLVTSNKRLDSISDQEFIEENKEELNLDNRNGNEHETQIENTSLSESQALLNSEGNSDKELMKTVVDTCDEPHLDKLNIMKPIGFDNDLDVSDGELEEYLRELEVLDESLDGEILVDEPLKELLDEKCFKGAEDESNCNQNNSNSHEFEGRGINNTVTEDEIRNVYNKSIINNCGSDDSIALSYKLLPSAIDNQGSSEEIISSSLYESEGKKSVLSIPQSDDYKSENDIHNNAKHVDCQIGGLSNDGSNLYAVPTVLNTGSITNETNKNPFEENDFTEVTENTVTSNHDFKEIESIPSDVCHGSAFCIKENAEVKKKSTNPFDVDDEDIYDNSGSNISDTSVDFNNAGSSTELNSVEISAKDSNSENTVKNPKPAQNVELISGSVISSTVAEQLLNGSLLHSVQEPIYSSTPDKEPNNKNDVSKIVDSKDNSTDKCLPSSSSTQSEPFDRLLESKAKMIPIKQAIESPSVQDVDESGIPAEEDRPSRPNSLELPRRITVEATTHQSPNTEELEREPGPEVRQLGKVPPFWIPDTDTTMCMQCQLKFTVLKRRHHCRACGQVLCNKCCALRARLEYMNFAEARVCQPCFALLETESASSARRKPNPNNPMEYCSTIPPLQQVAGSLHHPPPSVMVPVGVLKREGRIKSDVTKQVMFSDGIRPGGDLTELDGSGEPRMPFRRPGRLTKRVGTPPGGMLSPSMRRVLDSTTLSFIPADGNNALPPVVSRLQGEVSYSDLESPINLNQPTVKFALNRNLFVLVKRVLLDCCVNRECWCFSSEGLACVGQDEIVFLLECLPQETLPPKDVFLLINLLYQDAAKGSTVSEMSFTPAISNNLLDSRDHGGFLYIRTSYQCTAQLVLPSPPYLVALLIHRWETPWAKLFPIRLVLRLGAEFRYYPCPLVSVRNRPPLYTDIGHTIINILADFRKYSYTLPSVRGLTIHMEDRQTTINIPRNRYDQVVRALNNSNDSVLAFGANLSLSADSHLVCMQSTEEENTSYHTQAINIHNKPRKVTGASFVVFNGALKVPGLAGKSNIVEDGLMVQVPSETMVALRTALRDMRDYSINCGPVAEETVVVKWTVDDTNFNIGVKSCIDGRPLDGVPSIRVHNGTDYSGGARIIRWTEVFILQCEDSEHSSEPLDISRLSESIARATCLALVPLLDLLSAASLTTIAVRTTIHPDNVGYEAGSNGDKLPPLYMKSLDDELVAVVHQAALASQDNPAVLELVFRIMEQG